MDIVDIVKEQLEMGRKKGEPKDSVMVRMTPACRNKVEEIKKFRAKASSWSGSNRSFTNSLIIEQAINAYYKQWDRTMRDDTRCGYCDQKRI